MSMANREASAAGPAGRRAHWRPGWLMEHEGFCLYDRAWRQDLGETGTVVRFESVGLRYGMGPEVLKDLTFAIDPHSFQFLTGPSGAGKTTLLRLILLSLKPTRGLVTIFGADVSRLAAGD